MAENVKMLWGPAAGHAFGGGWNSATGSLTMNDAINDKVALIFYSPKTGNIDRIAFRTGGQSGTQVGRVSLKALDGATGDPTGGDYGGSAPGAWTPAANTDFSVLLAAPGAVTRGDILAVVIDLSGFTSGSVTVVYAASAFAIGGDPDGLPYVSTTTTGTWLRREDMPAIGIHFDDGDWISAQIGNIPGSVTYAPGVEVGFLFQIPFPARCFGAEFTAEFQAGFTFIAKLYDASDNVLAMQTYDSDAMDVGGDRLLFLTWPSSVSLLANTNYRVTIQHDSGSAKRMLRHSRMPDAAMKAGFPWSDGSRWTWTTRSGGAWTETTTFMAMCGLFLDQVG